jgi:hypothetical protein
MEKNARHREWDIGIIYFSPEMSYGYDVALLIICEVDISK